MPVVTFKCDFDIITSKIDLIKSSINKIAHEEMKTYMLPYIQIQIKRFIKDGGSSDPQYAWGYWERIGHDWIHKNGKMTTFSNGWHNASILPIHPMSFIARKVNRIPSANMFALNDTMELMNSFTSIADYTTPYGAEMYIGSTSSKLDYHEVSFKYKRKIIEPYSIIFSQDKAFHNNFMNRITSRLEQI